jgi:hypothetical protein
MKDEKRDNGQPSALSAAASMPNRILGSLRDALNAASRDDRSGEFTVGEKTDRKAAAEASRQAGARPPEIPVVQPQPTPLSAAEAVREAKARAQGGHYEAGDPTTRALRGTAAKAKAETDPISEAPKTQALRGKPKIARANFHQDPVVAWLVIVGGPGLGSFRPIFEGNNAIGRGKHQRIPLDFGDETISSEEQGYIRYDSMDRSFLFVPNLSKTNIVAVNDKKPTGAVKLEMMDVIRMGHTQLAFVPFCGDAFDWSELSELKE